MRNRSTWCGAAAIAGGALLSCSLAASCSSDGGGGEGTASPLTLVSECDQICSQLSACGADAVSLEPQCTSACGDLAIVPAGCLDPFVAYVTCLAGVTSVQCSGNGAYVVVTPPSCEADRQAFLSCNAGPSPVAACLALPGNTSCATAPIGSPPTATFCVGQPPQCTSPQPNPLGLGVFCCPATN
jgi:hypothetical protein